MRETPFSKNAPLKNLLFSINDNYYQFKHCLKPLKNQVISEYNAVFYVIFLT